MTIEARQIIEDISSDFEPEKFSRFFREKSRQFSAHSVKGFDYACVFVIGLDWLDGTRWTEEQIRNLTYVAIARTRERLYMYSV